MSEISTIWGGCAGFETIAAVLRSGFVHGRGLRRENGRNIFLRREILHPPEGNVPSINKEKPVSQLHFLYHSDNNEQSVAGEQAVLS